MSRIPRAVRRWLRPVYYRFPVLQRLRLRGARARTGLKSLLRGERHSSGNLPALQALAARRAEPGAWLGMAGLAPPVAWPLLDVSIVTYDSQEWVVAFVRSLLHQDYPLARLHLRLVDHGSRDDTVAQLRVALEPLRERFAGLCFLAQDNRGFGAGHDRAIRAGTAEFCLVTNIDLEFYPDALTTAVAAALQDTAATVASWELRQVPYEHPKYYDPVTLETNWSAHACILMRRSAYEKVGGYDARIFMYCEDVELSYRFRSYGYYLKYLPHAVVQHHSYRSAGEIKPRQYTGSTIGNLYLRWRYGRRADRLAGGLLYAGLLLRAQPFAGARRALLGNAGHLLRHWRHFRQGKGPAPAAFPFRAWDYALTRAGAFQTVAPVPADEAPLVSVITRTYRGRGWLLAQALHSVLNQTYPRLELIVVQDGGDSERVTLDALRPAAAGLLPLVRDLRFVSQPPLGRSAAGNAGLAAARGRYLMFLDDDDLLFADHVESLVRVLQGDAGLAAAYALSFEVLTDIDAEGQRYREKAYQTPAAFEQEWDYAVLQRYNFIPIQAIVFSRALYEERGGFAPTLDQLEDWHLWLRYGYRRRFGFLPKTTSLFRSPADAEVRARRALLLHQAYDAAKFDALRCLRDIDAGVRHG